MVNGGSGPEEKEQPEKAKPCASVEARRKCFV